MKQLNSLVILLTYNKLHWKFVMYKTSLMFISFGRVTLPTPLNGTLPSFGMLTGIPYVDSLRLNKMKLDAICSKAPESMIYGCLKLNLPAIFTFGFVVFVNRFINFKYCSKLSPGIRLLSSSTTAALGLGLEFFH